MTVSSGQLVGALSPDHSVEAFLGVPFAAPPTGPRRWRPPEPPTRFDEPVHATSFAPACMQGGYMADWYRGVVEGFGGDPAVVVDPAESEDCLYLNVWRPSARAAQLPVIVFIHGGGNAGGWSWEPNYLGENLAREGFVVVTVAYRLGVFGFFSHPDQAEANFGLLDQIAALRWIRTNAPALGADPDRITVMGESSGGNNIIHLMTAPPARGLFSRAIVQSSGWALHELPEKADVDGLGIALAEAVSDLTASLEALRDAPADRVFTAARDVFAGHSFDPVVDGHSLLEAPIETINRGALAAVDLVIGTNADEWRMYLPEEATLGDWSDQGLAPALLATTRPLLASSPNERQALDRAITAWSMVCPSLHLAGANADSGGRSWVYWFTRQREGSVAAAMGAYHGAELPYVFDTHDEWLPTAADDRQLTSAIVRYWSNFARTGDPNGGDLQFWPAFLSLDSDVLRLDVQPMTLPHPERPLCATLGVPEQTATTP